ncbi:hypothetical protein BC834DRAFT_1040537 [Gloeopeniophorella convolvens]|nr:hypothetical protein BC834DRAFT_1040537 [Gloeopeniophorella convolvens]
MLVCLGLSCPKDGPEVTLPKEFINTPAPRLKSIHLEGVAVPSLPKILTSIGDQLRNLIIKDIPEAEYFSPAALIPHMPTMSHLGRLDIHYLPSASHPQAAGRALPPSPLTTIVLPALTTFRFQGVSEDLEYLVSHFIAPGLDTVAISLHNQLTIDLTHLDSFLSRSNVLVHCTDVNLNIRRGLRASLQVMSDKAFLCLDVECKPLDWQISALAQICSSLRHSVLLTKTGLNSLFDNSRENPMPVPEPDQDEPEPEQWLELLQPFNAVEKFSVKDSSGVSSGFFQALRTLSGGGEGTLSVLPALRELRLEADTDEQSDALTEASDPFTEARRLADRPVAVSYDTLSSLRRG